MPATFQSENLANLESLGIPGIPRGFPGIPRDNPNQGDKFESYIPLPNPLLLPSRRVVQSVVALQPQGQERGCRGGTP